MGMLDGLRKGAGMLQDAGPGIGYLQARRMGVNPLEAMMQMQQMRGEEERMRYYADARKAEEEKIRKEQEAEQRRAAMAQSQTAAGSAIDMMTPEQKAQFSGSAAMQAWLRGPDADKGISEGLLAAATPQPLAAPRTLATTVGTDNIKRIRREDPTTGRQWDEELGAVRAPASTVVNVGDKSLEVAEAKRQAEWEDAMSQSANKAMAHQNTLARLKPLAEQISTGKITPGTATVGALLQGVGIDPSVVGIDPNLPATAEAFTAIANKLALSTRSTAEGGGMPGAMSDADRQFLVNTMPKLSNTPMGNMLILQTEDAMANRQIERYIQWVEYKAAAEERGVTPSRTAFERTWLLQSRSKPLFPVIATPEEAAKLPSGTIFTGSDGKVRVAP